MGYFYKKGEKKVRPGLYQRYENNGSSPTAGALVGYCAITIQANWGPLNEVVTVGLGDSLTKLFGTGGTVADAQALFDGGATTVYACRIGTGGTKASLQLEDASGVAMVNVEALYPGNREFAISVKNVLGDDDKKEFIITEGATVVEKFTYKAGSAEADNLLAAVAETGSEYVALTKLADGNGVLAPVQQVAMAGGANPTVTAADYSTGFNVLETMDWNTISVDTDDNAVHVLLTNFMDRVYQMGKFAMCVVGDPVSVDFATRLTKARSYNNALVVYFGSGWVDSLGVKQTGHHAVNHVAGIIASTSSSKAITHAVIKGATNVIERLTNEQYIEAINSGCLMLSMSPEKQVWFDSGVNTLLSP
ncbi:MAG: phage tail sheath subtilisin-like domain-containing protein, partial [Peptococcaceae bacterium]|nr:phage tail sheath subtilisin-like domain-containing protein [Peptococcaceae bacterium]